ncbi:hypothetical protein PHK61_26540 [Actinomycetospora lutea]|uniref:hypothetical protein n=1 Tax=Actinomycetospora lutea TaxID=663604 RepID=UPI00236620D3|nr:hypothetical protein [Actinomycetospora lutea]MDD7941979.1 hypothetical protein [Actinomycetospora lutea]
MAVYLVVGPEPADFMRDLVLWYAFLIIVAVVAPAARSGVLIFVSLTLYASSAWVAFSTTGIEYAPSPDAVTIFSATVDDVWLIWLGYVVVEALVGLERLGNAIRSAAARCRQMFGEAPPNMCDVAVTYVLLVVAAFDCVAIVRVGLGTVLADERRKYAGELLLGSNHNVQVICLAGTIYLVGRLALASIGGIPVFSLVALWAPFVLVGSRKELLVAGVVCVILLGVLVPIAVRLLLGGGIVFLLLLPLLKSGEIESAWHEVVLPQYTDFAVVQGLVPVGTGGTLLEKVQFLLPGPLRITEVQDFGSAFENLDLSGVGLGASPFAEARLSPLFGSYGVTFVAIFTILLLVLVVSARKMPLLTTVLYGLLLFYGRSDVATLLFFAVYVSLLLFLMLKFGSRSRALRLRRGAVRPEVGGGTSIM